MAMCDACCVLADGDGNEAAHERLKRGEQRVDKPFARPKIYTTYYQCETCGTNWRHIDDRDERFKAWAVVD